MTPLAETPALQYSTMNQLRTSACAPASAPFGLAVLQLIEGTEVVWQKPENELQGVLLAFHGCSHGAIDWWPPDDNCPLCTGQEMLAGQGSSSKNTNSQNSCDRVVLR